jgi:hypothetical protein
MTSNYIQRKALGVTQQWQMIPIGRLCKLDSLLRIDIVAEITTQDNIKQANQSLMIIEHKY